MNWDTTKEDATKLHQAAKRAAEMFGKEHFMTFDMDLTACHVNDQALDLDRLLAFEDGDFAHDIAGINRHIDRETGKLGGCFVPRCAAKQTTEEQYTMSGSDIDTIIE